MINTEGKVSVYIFEKVVCSYPDNVGFYCKLQAIMFDGGKTCLSFKGAFVMEKPYK